MQRSRFAAACCGMMVLALSLTGCFTSSRIQADYIAQRDDCRATAEHSATGSNPLTPQTPTEDVAAARRQGGVLTKIFTGCMNQKGWEFAAAKPNPPRTIAGGKPELDALSQGSRSSAARTAPQQQQPQPTVVYTTPATPLPADRRPVNAK
jgi:hypothetical protein